jgi:hypothetical protein
MDTESLNFSENIMGFLVNCQGEKGGLSEELKYQLD